jgi:hypothetical protein
MRSAWSRVIAVLGLGAVLVAPAAPALSEADGVPGVDAPGYHAR